MARGKWLNRFVCYGCVSSGLVQNKFIQHFWIYSSSEIHERTRPRKCNKVIIYSSFFFFFARNFIYFQHFYVIVWFSCNWTRCKSPIYFEWRTNHLQCKYYEWLNRVFAASTYLIRKTAADAPKSKIISVSFERRKKNINIMICECTLHSGHTHSIWWSLMTRDTIAANIS